MNRRTRYVLSLISGVVLGLGAWSIRSCSRPVAACVVARVSPAEVYRALLVRAGRV